MAKRSSAALITSAVHARSLDLAERQKRYLITMGIRTGCFLAFLVVPGWWKLVMLAGAAFLPAFAVLFANGADHHAAPHFEEEYTSAPMIMAGPVIDAVREDD
ncbi:MAG TPA: DUF3099 domain-containing protein [Tessaracoccus flavescens]|uniref:DUF3099 domain-containing protein n=1 Tax=Tessaracoccus flavescens TaxID=399497 RepID=A0A921EMR1_9ACTN|nr:DUF3099 domain-containing protein [Tessaracoccus flavescens]